MFLPDLVKQINALKKLARKEILYGNTALSGPTGCYVFGIDNSTGDLYYRDPEGNWALAASGGGGGGATCDTIIDASTYNNGCPLDDQYISLLIDDGVTPLPWRGTWEEFKTCIGAGGGGGTSLRFAVAGEDDIATPGEERLFNQVDENFYLDAEPTDGTYRTIASTNSGYVFIEADNDQGYAYAAVTATKNPGDEPSSQIYIGGSTHDQEFHVYQDETTITQFGTGYQNTPQNIVTSLAEHRYVADMTGDVELVSKAPNNGVLALPDGLYVPSILTDGLLYGGIVTWHHDYVYEVTAAGYVIDGVFYQSPAYTVNGGNAITLDPPDPTNDRIDVFYVDSSETVQVLEGTPAPTPVKPGVTANQIELSFATAETGTTEPTQPGQLAVEMIYNENLGEPTEWTGSVSNPTFVNLGSAFVVESGLSVRFQNETKAGEWVEFVNDAPVTVTSLSVLTLKVESFQNTKAQNKRLTIQFSFVGSPVGNSVTVRNNDYGIDWGNASGNNQTLSIALADFGITSSSIIDTVRFSITNTGNSTFPLGLDKIQLQGVPVTTPTPPSGGGPTNLALGTATSSTQPVTNSNGTGFTLPVFGTNAGLVPGTATSTVTYLRADGTWAIPPGSGGGGNIIDTLDETTGAGDTSSRDIYIQSVRVGRGASAIATNTAVGQTALNAITTGARDTAIGQEALALATTSPDNTAVGYKALAAYTTGLGFSTAVGSQALWKQTTGYSNTAIGALTMQEMLTGTNNTAVGAGALGLQSSGQNNVGVGAFALSKIVSGIYNTALGTSALQNILGAATRNLAVGTFAGQTLTSGDYNTLIGEDALVLNTSGSFNTVLGNRAGYGTQGSRNVMLGYRAGYNVTSGDDLLYISNSETNNLITGSFSAKTLQVDGRLTVTSLDTDGTAPTTSGTTKMVITDGTGQLSFADIPGGGGGGTYTADNGLTMASNNTKLGGLLTATTTIDAATYELNITGTSATTVLDVYNTGTAIGITSTSASGLAIYGKTTSGTGVRGDATANGSTGISAFYSGNNTGSAISANASATGTAISALSGDYTTNGLAGIFVVAPVTNNDVKTIIEVSRASLTPAAGVGGSLDFKVEKASGLNISNRLISKWTEVSTGTSEFSITGIDTNVTSTLLTLAGNGAAKLHSGYGTNAFTGTATYGLAVDASGNVITTALGGGGGSVTASNGLNVSGSDVRLGGTLANDTTIANGSYQLNFTGSSVNGANELINIADGGTGISIQANNSSSGIGMMGTTYSGVGVIGQAFTTGTGVVGEGTVGVDARSNGGYALKAQRYGTATTTLVPVMYLRAYHVAQTAAGFGAKIDFEGSSTNFSTPAPMGSVAIAMTNATAGSITANATIRLYNNSVEGEKFIVKASGVINFPVPPTDYADNAAAVTGGLVNGDVYRTGDFLKIVHA